MIQERDPRSQYIEKGKTISLLLHRSKPLYGTGRLVVLDSDFCVLQGIIDLKKKRVFAAALIKKRSYWPKHIKGDEIQKHMDSKAIGEVNVLHGTLDDVLFHVYCMKELDYVMMIMSTYGTNEWGGEEKH
eukprot:980260-Ditylum_brightwellii.AAC.2